MVYRMSEPRCRWVRSGARSRDPPGRRALLRSGERHGARAGAIFAELEADGLADDTVVFFIRRPWVGAAAREALAALRLGTACSAARALAGAHRTGHGARESGRQRRAPVPLREARLLRPRDRARPRLVGPSRPPAPHGRGPMTRRIAVCFGYDPYCTTATAPRAGAGVHPWTAPDGQLDEASSKDDSGIPSQLERSRCVIRNPPPPPPMKKK